MSAERRYSRRDLIPFDLKSRHVLTILGENGAVWLGCLRAAPDGLTASLEIASRSEAKVRVGLALGGRVDTADSAEIQVWSVVNGIDTASHVQSAAGGSDAGGLSKWVINLWFPFDVTALTADPTIFVCLRALSANVGSLVVPAAEVLEAAEQSLEIR